MRVGQEVSWPVCDRNQNEAEMLEELEEELMDCLHNITAGEKGEEEVER
jgi:hypothetical protein